MARVGVIDCGTNSIRLLVADVSDGNLREISREMEIVRLGQGVDQTGEFHPDAIARTLAAVDLFASEDFLQQVCDSCFGISSDLGFFL